NIYKEEDVFVLKIRDTEISMSEIELKRREQRGKKTVYIKVFSGVVYKIPKHKYVTEMPIGKTKIMDNNYVYVLKPKDKDLFEFKLFQKMDPGNLEKFITELQQNIEYILNYIQKDHI
ncbi:MAG: hypothetical protein NZM44_04530, partial [Candidatus Calescibacterium sp.]|nr:hypothetical protein [Candidatus Calescibacterium sp.]